MKYFRKHLKKLLVSLKNLLPSPPAPPASEFVYNFKITIHEAMKHEKYQLCLESGSVYDIYLFYRKFPVS